MIDRFSFENPSILWIIAAAISVSIISFTFRKGSRYLKPYLLILRLAALVSLCAALAQPVIENPESQHSSTIVLDLSSSMNAESTKELLERARMLARSYGEVTEVAFGRKAEQITSNQRFENILENHLGVDRGATDITKALQLSAQVPGENILLISDGNSTEGSERQLLSEARRINRKIFPITPLTAQNTGKTLIVTSLDVPLRTPAKTVVPFRTSVRNTTTENQNGRLRFVHGGKEIFSQKVSIPSGQELVTEAKGRDDLEGIQEVTVSFQPEDKLFSTSSITRYINHGSREKVLLLSGSASDHKFLAKALKDQGYQLIDHELSSPLSPAVQSFNEYSAVLFNNVSYSDIGQSFLSKLETYVKQGGGFIMVGGDKSYGLGKYIGTSMEDILPVKLLPPRTEKKRLNSAVALVLDKSRSMAADQKLDFAKEAAKEVIRNLKDEDYVGVMGFDSTPFVVVQIGRIGKIRSQALGKVNRLFPAGRTNLLPAIDEARRSLERVTAGRKHIIILTDGKLPDAGPYYLEIVRQLRILGITVSTVLLGSGVPDDMLQAMSQAGGGSFYQTADASKLPRIFLQDVKVNAGEQSLRESQEYVVRRGKDKLISTSLLSFPPLRGFVEVGEKKGGAVELIARNSSETKPLLASGKFGKGRVIAFTSDASGRWSNNWVQWSKFHQFWIELLTKVRKEKETDALQKDFDIRSIVKQRNLDLEIVVYEPVSSPLSATIRSPLGKELAVPVKQIAPGRFSAEIQKAIPGKYEIQLADLNGNFPKVALAVEGSDFGERTDLGVNLEVLSNLAEGSGGRINPRKNDLASKGKATLKKEDLRSWFFAAALLFIFCEIILRELPRIFKAIIRRNVRI
jgi:Ca-activated chloride channel homolog